MTSAMHRAPRGRRRRCHAGCDTRGATDENGGGQQPRRGAHRPETNGRGAAPRRGAPPTRAQKRKTTRLDVLGLPRLSDPPPPWRSPRGRRVHEILCGQREQGRAGVIVGLVPHAHEPLSRLCRLVVDIRAAHVDRRLGAEGAGGPTARCLGALQGLNLCGHCDAFGGAG